MSKKSGKNSILLLIEIDGDIEIINYLFSKNYKRLADIYLQIFIKSTTYVDEKELLELRYLKSEVKPESDI
jgi:hypothetical protein